ncbi:MAG: M23 family metallopeptidase [Patescibacteria group bacterium]
MLFGRFFYTILVKIYYRIFRLKNNELTRKAIREILDNQAAYWLIFILIAGFILANLTNQNEPGALEAAIAKTTMAQLVIAEFDAPPSEELIEESATPGRLTAKQEKYVDISYTADKQTDLLPEENIDQNNFLTFNTGNDVIFKPLITGQASQTANNLPAQRTEIIYYTVQNGDTASSIANRFNITVNTILWANNLGAYSLIRPGDRLTILPYSGVLYTVKSGDTLSRIAAKYGIDADDILSRNDLAAGLQIGQKIVLPGARKISEATPAVRTSSSRSGLSVISNLLKTPPAKSTGGSMVWPTPGHRITQYFSWRHTGIDIADKVGTPIYAADAGVVEIARGGWNGGYGNTIVINHGGGKKTRYGHASKLFVKVGDEVKKGENIAAMGSTGRSSGSHLHFEILINGARYNPLNYVR